MASSVDFARPVFFCRNDFSYLPVAHAATSAMEANLHGRCHIPPAIAIVRRKLRRATGSSFPAALVTVGHPRRFVG
jgi:hypothetical protein